MTSRKPAKQYAIFYGRERRFPKNQVLHHGEVFEIEISPPSKDYTFYRVKVLAPKWSLYIPYSNAAGIWEDWMPFDGRRVDGEEADAV